MTHSPMPDHYPIREFARLTGVNPITLRAWERRYGIIQPHRTEKGHRYYTDAHVEQVNSILYWLDQGYPIRQVKLLLKNAAVQYTDEDDNWQSQQANLLQAAQSLNPIRLEELWNQGLSNYPMAVYYQHCILPVVQKLRQAQEHPLVLQIFVYSLKRKLQCLIHQQQKHNQGDTLLLATNHETSELDVLAIAYALGAAAFRVDYFGHQLSTADLTLAADSLSAHAVWLHLSPCSQSQQQQWSEFVLQQKRTLYISGVMPSPLESHSDDWVEMPNDLQQQIKHYITHLNQYEVQEA